MRKCRCIIADDEPLAVKLLESYCRRIDDIDLAGTYTSAAAARDAIAAGGIDLAVLDIQMPGLSGIEIARCAGDSTAVIFVTAYPDYALEGFKVHAADYLLKPVSYEDFSASVSRVTARLAPVTDTVLTVRSDYRSVPIDMATITHIEGLKDYIKIYISGRERPVLTQMSLKAIESQLPADRFIRVHRSFIINRRHIAAYDRSGVNVAGVNIPVGDTFRARFLEILS